MAILSAAQPIFIGDDIVGAAIVEETTGSIQILKESALEDLLAVTLAVVAGALAILLVFASRLAARIRRLHARGRCRDRLAGAHPRRASRASDARDEIGDLSRTMAAVLARLQGIQRLPRGDGGPALARAAHAGGRGALLARQPARREPLPESARVYLERAGEGVDRLSRLIARLSEATRLERLLESAERERFDLAKVVAGCVEGYRATYPGAQVRVRRARRRR